MKPLPRRLALLAVFALPAAFADQPSLVLPSGWQAQPVPTDERSQRQRAVKNNASGEPQMVLELTRSPLQPGHVVNLPSVLLQMRKTIQIDFIRNGFMSVCNSIRPSTLGNLDAVESTCTITQNGVPVMKQTLVAAVSPQTAWSLSYAGSTEGYTATEAEVRQIRDGLQLHD